MLRIDVIERGDRAVLMLEGRVMGAWVDEVRRSCRDALGRGTAVTLDLGAVSFVDADGVVLLRELASRHVALANTTPFVAAQLRG
jgi:anti-anti-sigma regulatory factor